MTPPLLSPLASPASAMADALPLRDIVLPTRIGWWPPAPGWWLVLILVLTLVGLAVYVGRRYRRRQRIVKPARQLLMQIERRFARHGDSRQLLQELSTLLRQVALSQSPREQVAGLVGEAWLQWLDQGLEDQPFSTGVGRALADQAYRPAVEISAEPLLELCDRWLIIHARGNN